MGCNPPLPPKSHFESAFVKRRCKAAFKKNCFLQLTVDLQFAISILIATSEGHMKTVSEILSEAPPSSVFEPFFSQCRSIYDDGRAFDLLGHLRVRYAEFSEEHSRCMAGQNKALNRMAKAGLTVMQTDALLHWMSRVIAALRVEVEGDRRAA